MDIEHEEEWDELALNPPTMTIRALLRRLLSY